MAHALGIDVGTTNVKVALVRDDGTIVAAASQPIATQRAGDVAEQSPEQLWAAVLGAVRGATAIDPVAAGDVVAVVCDSQYSSIVPVDAQGRAAGDMLTWMDQRGAPHLLALLEREQDAFTTFVEHHGIPPIGGGIALGHILYLQQERPAVYEQAAAFLEPMDFVNLRLTGRAAATQCTMFMSLLCDNRVLGATTYDAELVRMAGVDAAKLPPLLVAGDAVGPLLPEVAAELGLPRGAMVHTGVNDSQVQAIATGIDAPGRGAVVIGTTSVILDCVDRKETDLEHQVLSMPGPIAGDYLVWAENGIGGKALDHVLEHVVYASDALGDHASPDRFAALDLALSSVPPGSHGTLFLPWLNGSLAPRADGSMRGGFINLSLDTTRGDLVRAVVEGVCLNLRWLLPAVERFTGHRIDDVVFAGGAARSSVWAQALADVLDRPVHTLAAPDLGAARGSALLALHDAGVLGRRDLAALVACDATFAPRPELRATYDRLGDQLVAAFDATRPIIEVLQSGRG
jgi:xylulokinase